MIFAWLREVFGGSNRRRAAEEEAVRRNPPAELPPKRPKPTTPDGFCLLGQAEYQAEYEELIRRLFEKFAIEDTPYDRLLESMNALETEISRNGGCNWKHRDYVEHLDFIREHLAADSQFNLIQRRNIAWSLDEVTAFGKELEEQGRSSRRIEEPLAFLVARVVDWCRTHPTEADDNPGQKRLAESNDDDN